MTMPTSPLWDRVEVRFPADFTSLYSTPLGYFGGGGIRGGTGGNPEGVAWPPVDGFANDSEIYHKQKAQEAVEQVARHVRNLQVQRINQITHMPSQQMGNTADERTYIEGDSGVVQGSGFFGDALGTLFGAKTAPLVKAASPFLRYIPGIGSYAGAIGTAADMIDKTFNKPGAEGSGRWSYSPGTGTIEGAPVLAGRAKPLRGGVMRTQAGRQYVQSRLSARIDELNLRDSVGANTEPPPSAPVEALEGGEEIGAIGDYMDVLDDNFTSGAIDTESLAAARGLLKNLTKVGFRIPQNIITPILRQVTEMLSTVEALTNTPAALGAYKPTGDRAKRLRTIFQILERCRTILIELSEKSDLSSQERQMALRSLEAGPLQEQVVHQRARRPRAVPRPIPLQEGQTGYVYPYPTQENPRAPRQRR